MKTWLTLMGGVIAWMLLMVLIMNRPFSMQILVAVGYTFMAALQIFFATKIGDGFDIHDVRVRSQLPKLLLINFGFVLIVVAFATFANLYKQHIPQLFLEEDKKGVPHLFLIEVIFGTGINMAQVLWSRMILGHAIGLADWSYWEGCWRRSKRRHS